MQMGEDARPTNQQETEMKTLIAATVTAAALAFGMTGAWAMGSNNPSPAAETGADATYKKAVEAVEAKQYRAAVGLLNKAIEEKPRNPDALNYLGYSHRKLGDYALAVSYYKRALALEPDHRGANEYLGEAYVELGNLNGAAENLAALERICGTDCKEYKVLKAAIDAARAKAAKQG